MGRADIAATKAEAVTLREAAQADGLNLWGSADSPLSVAFAREEDLRADLVAVRSDAVTLPEAVALLAASNVINLGVENLRAEFEAAKAEAATLRESADSAS